ncbi:TonB-dependent receptor [Mucilaginibacter dorajii]|uniref:TonB-dependent receptor n=1 Tax=Mucilaginibacter dorajii TaxID=692994 RepID=A0ABP7PHR1_9SPHI|nr:TonB-dependent receptor [Mucilaginibacter dorajii]MCS3733395.1 TonB-dependent receptor [Mucilaginibacter dorajii]
MFKLKVYFTLLIFILTISTALFAQSPGKIAGRITDKKTGETLIGASIGIEGTTKGASTNVDGRFLLSDLQPGKYTLSIRYIGYQSKSISDVEVKAGAVVQLDATLEEASTQALKEVTIRATYRQESVNALYARQKTSIQVTDGISADVIRRSPDRNTGDVLKRVSGTSVQDGKFVVIRGLAERYNNNLLNNAVLPSSEPDKKAFAFDIIPSSMVDNIVVYKTATPDLPGDFSGGTINTITKDIPDNQFLEASLSVGYNSKTTFKNNFINARPSGKYDFLGFDDGSRKLPAAYSSVKNNYTSGTTSDQKVAIAQQFPNTFYYQEGQNSLPNIGFQFSTGNSHTSKSNNRFGYNFSLNYSNGHRSSFGDRIGYTGFNDASKELPLYSYDRNVFSNYKSLGGLLNFAYTFGRNKIALRNLYNNDFTVDFEQTSNALNFEASQTDPLRYRGYSVETTQNGIYSSVLEGQHTLGKRNIIFDWNASYGLSYRNQPDQRIVTVYTPLNQPEYISLSSENSPKPNDLGRVYSTLHENISGAKANLAIPFKWMDQPQRLKFGGLISHRSRDFSIDALGYTDAVGFGNRNIILQNGYTTANVFSPESIKSNGIDLSRLDQSSTDYTGKADQDAGYLMLDNKFTNKLRFVWGARVERYNQTLLPAGKTLQEYNNTDVLPSGNLTYGLTEKANFRASYFRSVNRPEFRELASFRYFDYQTNFIISGNPALQRSLVDNADIRYEYFPSGGEIISVSAFYKKFKNPIEQINQGNDILTYQNALSAKDIGVEAELRKKLNFIAEGSFLRNVTFYVNASYINAKVKLADGRAVSTPLQGQSPYLINSGLYYTPDNADFSFNILYNRIGERLKFRAVTGGVDIYEKPRDVIDMQLSKALFNKHAEIKLTVSDLLAQPFVYYNNYGSSSSTAYKKGEDKVIQSRYSGFGTTLSFKYNFDFKK